MKEYFKKIGMRRIGCTILGVVLIGFGTAILKLSGFGTDPFSCMTIGISNHLPISLGTFQLLLNFILFIPIVILYPRSFGFGAFFNMLGVGYIIDFFMWIFGLLGITTEGVSDMLAVRIVCLLIGILIYCMGAALYMECDLGIATYDGIGIVIEDRSKGKFKFKWVRICTDFICMGIGFLSGGTLGVATVVVGFFTGPLVSWGREHIANPLVYKKANTVN
jgi:uncharacterized membrane protein YczE